MRTAEVQRTTKETDVRVSVNLDGGGSYDVATGIGFLDHMLEQFARHALIDLTVRAEGDLHIDQHHTTEDVGITIGQALDKALGRRAGIHRYGHAYVPMDETLVRAVLDFSGRPMLTWKVAFDRDKIGGMDTELFREWFQGLVNQAGLTLHLECLYGVNNHHIVEGCYKALARAMRSAVEVDPRKDGAIPSTKGTVGGEGQS